jgi:hypothetical protein
MGAALDCHAVIQCCPFTSSQPIARSLSPIRRSMRPWNSAARPPEWRARIPTVAWTTRTHPRHRRLTLGKRLETGPGCRTPPLIPSRGRPCRARTGRARSLDHPRVQIGPGAPIGNPRTEDDPGIHGGCRARAERWIGGSSSPMAFDGSACRPQAEVRVEARPDSTGASPAVTASGNVIVANPVLRSLRGLPVARPAVWLMRQAGRYRARALPERVGAGRPVPPRAQEFSPSGNRAAAARLRPPRPPGPAHRTR